jgi:hypothetical protein
LLGLWRFGDHALAVSVIGHVDVAADCAALDVDRAATGIEDVRAFVATAWPTVACFPAAAASTIAGSGRLRPGPDFGTLAEGLPGNGQVLGSGVEDAATCLRLAALRFPGRGLLLLLGVVLIKPSLGFLLPGLLLFLAFLLTSAEPPH